MSSKIRKEQELSLNQIFKDMISNSNIKFGLYSRSNINKEYFYHRNNILNILHKITNRMGFKTKIFFLSANYLDIIFTSKKNIKNKFNIYTLSLACLCLAAKFYELDSIVPQLYYFIKIYYNIIGNKIKIPITVKDLKYAEVFILKLLNYNLNYSTIYDFNSFLFINGILNNQQKFKNSNDKQILERIYKKTRYYMDSILMNNKLLFKYDSLILAIFIIDKSIKEILVNDYKKMHFNEIMKNIFDFNYEDNEQYQKLIIDEEIKIIFDNNRNNKETISNNIYKKIEEKKENNNVDKFDKSSFMSSEKNLNLNFDINKIKKIYQKIKICKRIISKEKDVYKTSNNFNLTNIAKKEYINQDNTPNTLRNELNNSIFNQFNQSREKNLKSQPKIIYSKYTYSGDKYNYTERNTNTNKKNMNSSVECKNKNINLNKYILTSQKKRNIYNFKSTGKSYDDNKSIKNLYQKKLIEQKAHENYKTINSYMDILKINTTIKNIVKMNPNERRKENSIEHKNKNDLQKSNFFKKINYNKLIQNKINKNSSLIKNIENNVNNNISNLNKIDKNIRNKIIFLNNINNYRNDNESSQTITAKSRHINILKESNISKKLNDININSSKEKNIKNFNIYKYQKNNSKIIQIKSNQKLDNRSKNKLSYLLGKQNSILNNTLKEINNSYANNNRYKNKISLNKDISLNLALQNNETFDFFKTQKNSFYKIKPDKRKEEIIKNQQDKNFSSKQNSQQEKNFSSSIIINNNTDFNSYNKNMNKELIQYNNIYKKNKVLDMQSNKFFNFNNRNTVNGFNNTFYKTYLYTQEIENGIRI